MPSTLSPHDFVAKWRITRTKERSSSQEHFIDLCRIVGVPTPNEGDPTGESYAFEKGANKQLGGQGWADVWKRGCFAWEYKGKHADLDKAYRQLQQYRESLRNPPLLITSDLERIIIHTNITNSVKRVYEIALDDIEANAWMRPLTTVEQELKPLALLRLIFTEYPADQHPLRSPETTEKVTQKAAQLFGAIAREMQQYGEQPQATAHFLIRVLFCLFAEDIGLLPRHLMRNMTEASGMKPNAMARRMKQLFAAMRDGGPFGNDDIKHFNGGLFDSDDVLELTGNALLTLREVSGLDWCAIEPSIFGTLFERGLDPAKRSQLGAHYTSRDDIQLIVQPVLMAPLRREWTDVQAKARAALSPLPLGEGLGEGYALSTKADHRALAAANDLIVAFHDKLANTKVLDPACGSGNFLYVALRELLTLEKEVITLCDELGLPRPHLKVSPAQLYGIELNAYAHELAQATVWIGYIQWRSENGFGFPNEPILGKLDNIQNRDAILAFGHSEARSAEESLPDSAKQPGEVEILRSAQYDKPTEPTGPAADVIIGNPPFLGDKKMRSELGDAYVDALRKLYKDRIPGQSDLVCYWFEKARAMIEAEQSKRAGLIATNSIRKGVNRETLERIKKTGDIFYSWSDREWILDGAAVRVSIVEFDNSSEPTKQLDGKVVPVINSDLTAASDVTTAYQLKENANLCFLGVMKAGPFDIDGETALRMLSASNNPNGRPNSDVVKRRLAANEITQGQRNIWIIDFGVSMPIEVASQYEAPFEYVRQHVKSVRVSNNRKRLAEKWWIHGEARPGLRRAISRLHRCIVTPEVAKYRVSVVARFR